MINKSKALQYGISFLLHSFFWIVVYSFYAYFLGYGSSNVDYVNTFSSFLMPVTILISYFFVYFLIPRYLLTKKYQLFILYSVYTFIISGYLIILTIMYGLIYSEGLKEGDIAPLTKTLPFIILGVFFVVTLAIALSLIRYSYLTIIKNENLRSKILNTQLQLKEQELKFLKMQIHPHFLFNSLNTIYGFALKKSDEAPEMILKLSNLLDYILYQIEKPQVLLKDEINHLIDYVELEKMRFHDTLEVVVETNNYNQHVQIAPMLLIPFVENSFKHGSIIEGKLTVNIQIKTVDGTLLFDIWNSSTIEEEAVKGIGLGNIEKRLNMLYPKTHKLETSQLNNRFAVQLEIHHLNTSKND